MKPATMAQSKPARSRPKSERPEVCSTMRAAIFAGPEQLRVEEIATPRPGPGQVLVRLEGCGVCGSNLPVYEGRSWFNYPFEPGSPGHEGWGRVAEVGEGVLHVSPGQRVAMLSFHAYAQYDVAGEDEVVALPPSLDNLPFPGEPLGCAMNILRRSKISPGQTVAVVGVGFLGALMVSLCSRAGARVIAIGRRPAALKMARRLGAEETIEMNDHWKIVDQVKALTGRAGCDRVIEAVGLQWPLDLAGDLTRERGRLIIAGYHQDGLRRVNMQMWNWKGVDVINAHERDPRVYIQGIREAVAAVASGALDPTPLFTHAFKLEELPQAFKLMQERPEEFFKGLVTL